MSKKTGLALLLGGPVDDESADEEKDSDDGAEHAMRALAKALERKNWRRAVSAFRELVTICDSEDDADEDEELESEEDY